MKEYPKNYKYGRVFRVKLKNYEKSTNYLNIICYQYGLKVLENSKLTMKHLISINRLLKKLFKKNIFLKYNVSMTTPVTKKPLETRMGKGKAERSYWECSLKKGCIILEVGNVSKNKLKYAFRLVSEKLPFLTKVVKLVY